MKRSIIIMVATNAAVVSVAGYPVCPTKAYKAGYDLAEKKFIKMWDNEDNENNKCQQLDDMYNTILSKSPVLKCQKRGYYDATDVMYEKYSVECFPTCAGTGEKIGKHVGKLFCEDDNTIIENTTIENTTIENTICNIAEENACMDTFFDYAFENCNEKRMGNLSLFDKYMTKYCNKQIID